MVVEDDVSSGPLQGPVQEDAEQAANPEQTQPSAAEGARTCHSSRNRDYLRLLSEKKKAVQEQEALAAQRTQKLQRKLARQVLGSSFDAITSRAWALPHVSSSSRRHSTTDTEPPSDNTGSVSDGDGISSKARQRLPSLPEGKAIKRSTGDLTDAAGRSGDDKAEPTPRHQRWRRNTAEGEAVGCEGTGTISPRTSRSGGLSSSLSRSISLPMAQGRDTDKDKPSSSSSKVHNQSPTKVRRDKDKGTLPMVNRDKDALPPGVALYYQAKAAQEAQSQFMARVYNGGSSHAAYLQWRKRQKIPDHVKVFSMSGTGNHSQGIRSGLLARGWQENPDHNSPYFDFRWSINPLDVNHELLWPAQTVNHFSKATCITTKVGLCKTVRELAWYEPADYLAFYPRGYDLNDDTDRAAWLEDAKQSAAEALVKRAAAEGAVRMNTDSNRNPTPRVDLDSLRLALRVCVARLAQDSFLQCEQQAMGSRTASQAGAVDASTRPAPKPVTLTPTELQQLMRHPCLSHAPPTTAPPQFDPSWMDRTFISSLHTAKTGRGGKGGRKSSRCKTARKSGRKKQAGIASGAVIAAVMGKHEDVTAESGKGKDGGVSDMDLRASWDTDSSGTGGQTRASASPSPAPAAHENDDCKDDYDQEDEGSDGSEGGEAEGQTDQEGGEPEGRGDGQEDGVPEEVQFDPGAMSRADLPVLDITEDQVAALDVLSLLKLAVQVADALEQWHLQTHINGMNNIWIVKPAGKSRGRGIRLFNNTDDLLAYVKGDDALSLDGRWVAQKYVERPLIIQSRKFDIRQWVLVTAWNPLTVWFYDTCYLRFAADDYSASDLDIYLHLSNNSVAKYYEKAKTDDITAQGNMWDIPQFKDWLLEQYGQADLWETLIQPAMQHIVVCTTRCAQDMVHARKNSCQLYGYDFLIDDQLRVWLLEVNSSPTMEASTPITTVLCADVQEDILKVVVDLPEAKANGTSTSTSTSGTGQDPDTGKWRCIVDMAAEMHTPLYTGLNLELKGKSMATVPPKKTPQPTNQSTQNAQSGTTDHDNASPVNPRPAAPSHTSSSPNRLVPSCYLTHQAQTTAARQAIWGHLTTPSNTSGTANPVILSAATKRPPAPSISPKRLQRTISHQDNMMLMQSQDVTPFGGATLTWGTNGNKAGGPSDTTQGLATALSAMPLSTTSTVRPPSAFAQALAARAASPNTSLNAQRTSRPTSGLPARMSLELGTFASWGIDTQSERLIGQNNAARRLSGALDDPVAATVASSSTAADANGIVAKANAAKVNLIKLVSPIRAPAAESTIRPIPSTVAPRCMTVLRPSERAKRASLTNMDWSEEKLVEQARNVLGKTPQPQPGSWPVNGLVMVPDAPLPPKPLTAVDLIRASP